METWLFDNWTHNRKRYARVLLKIYCLLARNSTLHDVDWEQQKLIILSIFPLPRSIRSIRSIFVLIVKIVRFEKLVLNFKLLKGNNNVN